MKEDHVPHVTVAGDRNGDSVIREERPDGTLILTPETPAQASLRRLGARPATSDELDAFLDEHRGHLQPADDEG
jgi:hypothetical protein